MGTKITREEFHCRFQSLYEGMQEKGIDTMIVYGDEYRKENLRYVSNYWPIFERGAAIFSLHNDPILLCAPECEKVAAEMSVISDIRLVSDFLCVTVSDAIDYPWAKYTSFKEIAKELCTKKLGIAGIDAMSKPLYDMILCAFNGHVVDANDILYRMRKIKSTGEIACLIEAARIADAGYAALMRAAVPGATELQMTGAAEGTARAAGGEAIIFSVVGDRCAVRDNCRTANRKDDRGWRHGDGGTGCAV